MVIPRFLPRPTPLITVSFFKQKSVPIINIHGSKLLLGNSNPLPFLSALSARSLLFSNSLSSSQAALDIPTAVVSEVEYDNEMETEEAHFGAEKDETGTEDLEGVLEPKAEARTARGLQRILPSLSVKEKKELASYAHSLGKKLKSQQVGKSGVTDTVITALIETLEANELLKLKIHNTCPGELDDVMKQLEEGTGSVVVGQIGRTVILYRPSLSKMKAGGKKQAQTIPTRKQPALNQTQMQSKTKVPRQFGRGRRGSSRSGA